VIETNIFICFGSSEIWGPRSEPPFKCASVRIAELGDNSGRVCLLISSVIIVIMQFFITTF